MRIITFLVGPKPKPRKFDGKGSATVYCKYGKLWFALNEPAKVNGEKSMQIREDCSIDFAVYEGQALSICSDMKSKGSIIFWEESEGEG